MSFGLGIAAGGFSKGFSEGVRDMTEWEKQETARQNRELAKRQEERRAEAHAQAQADNAAEAASYKSVAESMRGRQEQFGGYSGVETQAPSGKMNLGGPEDNKPSKGVGVADAASEPSYDIAEGETAPSVGKGLQTKEAPVQAPGGQQAAFDESRYTTRGVPTRGPALGDARKVFMANPNKHTMARYTEALKSERDAAELAARLEESRARVSESRVRTEGLGLANERTRRTMDSDVRLSEAQASQAEAQAAKAQIMLEPERLEANRKVAQTNAQLAAAQSKSLDPNTALLLGENATKVRPIFRAVEAAYDAGTRQLGFKTKITDSGDGGVLINTYDSDGRLVGDPQKVQTSQQLEKLISGIGVMAMPEMWNGFNLQASTAQFIGEREAEARALQTMATNKAEAAATLGSVNREMLPQAVDKAKRFQEMIKEPNGYLKHADELREIAHELGAMYPEEFMTQKVVSKTRDAEGNEVTQTVPTNRLISQLEKASPPTTYKITQGDKTREVPVKSLAYEIVNNWGSVITPQLRRTGEDKLVGPARVEAEANAVFRRLMEKVGDRRTAEFYTKMILDEHNKIEETITRHKLSGGIQMPQAPGSFSDLGIMP